MRLGNLLGELVVARVWQEGGVFGEFLGEKKHHFQIYYVSEPELTLNLSQLHQGFIFLSLFFQICDI
jgi:hypothetical protein